VHQGAGESTARSERPAIFNTDQRSQFTSPRFTGLLPEASVRISMDECRRWMDNITIKRLSRSLKYERVRTHAFETGSELRAGLPKWTGYYNARPLHSPPGERTPDATYYSAIGSDNAVSS
jgi:putative transposase